MLEYINILLSRSNLLFDVMLLSNLMMFLFAKNKTKRYRLVYIISTHSMAYFILTRFVPNISTDFIHSLYLYFSSLLILTTLLHKDTWMTRFFTGITYLIVLFLIRLISSNIMVNIIYVLSNEYSTMLQLALNSLTLVSIYLIMCFFRQNHLSMILVPLSYKLWTVIYPVLLTLFVVSLTQFNLDLTIYQQLILYGLLLTLTFVFYLMFSLLTHFYIKQMQNEISSQQKKSYKSYQNGLEQTYSELKQLRHEIKNELLYIYILVQNKSYNELEDHLEKISNISSLNSLQIDTGNLAVDSLLNQKSKYAMTRNIKMKFNLCPIPDLPIEDIDLFCLIANLMDNAIEATVKSDNPNISIECQVTDTYTIWKITNSVASNVLQDNPHMQTSKRDKRLHGIGLVVVKSILENNDGEMRVYSDASYFTTHIYLKR